MNEEEMLQDKIIKIIRDNENNADRSVIRKKSKIESEKLDSVLRLMEYHGRISSRTEHKDREQGGGNPKTYYSTED